MSVPAPGQFSDAEEDDPVCDEVSVVLQEVKFGNFSGPVRKNSYRVS